MSEPPPYETFDHTADLGVRVRAPTLGRLLETAAFALFDQMLGDARRVEEVLSRDVEVRDAADPGDLLVSFLSRLHTLADTEDLVFSRIEVRAVDESSVRATAHGAPYDPERHGGRVDIKAVTYHALEVVREDGGWRAQFILDV